ncbi:MAG: hypothetical protein ACRDLO_01225, partial [Solirubrobacterales bacterium]
MKNIANRQANSLPRTRLGSPAPHAVEAQIASQAALRFAHRVGIHLIRRYRPAAGVGEAGGAPDGRRDG